MRKNLQLSVLLFAMFLAVCPALLAQHLPLPLSAPLENGTVTIEAMYADIIVEIDPEATPFIEARAFDEEGPAQGQLERRIKTGTESWTRHNSSASDGNRPVYELRLVVGRGQQIQIQGSDLNISLLDLVPQEGKASSQIDLDVEASDVELTSIRSADLKGRSTFVRIHDGRGDFSLDLENCRLDLDGHRGGIELLARGGETVLQNLDGKLEIDLVEHRLDVFSSNLNGTGKALDGILTLEDWQGSVDFEVEGSNVQASTARRVRSQFNLKGSSSTVTATGIDGTTFVNLQGGSFRGRDLGGTTQTIIRGQGTADLQNIDGVVKVNLTEGASARLADLSGRVRAAITESQVEAERIFSLKVEAIRSRVTAQDIRRQEAVSLTDSVIDIDMSDAEDASAFILRGNSTARVRVPRPCLVRVNTAPEVQPEQVRVEGCENPSYEASARARVRSSEMLVLTASLRDASELEVNGVER